MAGKLLYSFDEEIRQQARDLFITWFYPLLLTYLDNEKNSEAHAILFSAAINHDVYHHWRRGEKGFANFQHYLTRSLKYVTQRVFWQKVPSALRKQMSEIWRFQGDYRARNGVMPTIEAIGEVMGTDAHEVSTLFDAQNLYFAQSLDAGWEQKTELGVTIVTQTDAEVMLLGESESEMIEEKSDEIEEISLPQWHFPTPQDAKMLAHRALGAAL